MKNRVMKRMNKKFAWKRYLKMLLQSSQNVLRTPLSPFFSFSTVPHFLVQPCLPPFQTAHPLFSSCSFPCFSCHPLKTLEQLSASFLFAPSGRLKIARFQFHLATQNRSFSGWSKEEKRIILSRGLQVLFSIFLKNE